MVKTDLDKSLDVTSGSVLLSGGLFYDGELFLHFMDKNINSDAAFY